MKYIGAALRRREDPRLLKGESTFVDDIRLPGMLHAAFVRSQLPRARIRKIDVSAARGLEGVVGVYTGVDLRHHLGPLAVESIVDRSRFVQHFPLAVEEARYVGEPLAVVVADDRYTAWDAADLVKIEYEPMPAVIDPEKALEDNSPRVHSELADNICFRLESKIGDVERLFQNADHVVEGRFRIQRLAPTAMEPRGVVAQHDSYNNLLTVWSSTQFPHKLRTWISHSLNLSENRVRVIAPDVGGGFGSKLNHYPEEVIIPHLAMKLNRPIKWFESRAENLSSTTHGRDMIVYVSAAARKDGKLLAVKLKLIADLGAYNYVYSQDNPVMAAKMVPGCYKLEGIGIEVIGVYTNKMATDAYRGAGRPEASYIIERTMDLVAKKLNIDPADLRRRNFIDSHEFPYKTLTDFEYDSGDYDTALSKALELAKYHELRATQPDLWGKGKYLGVGISSFVEVCNFSYQSATVRVEPSGRILILTSTSPHGQGEETAFSQIVAETLGVSPDEVQVIHGDTLAIPYGWGTAGSWTLTAGGNAILNACNQMKKKMQTIAAAKLECSPEDIVMTGGRLFVEDVPEKNLSFGDVAAMAYDPGSLPTGVEMGLVATSFYNPDLTFPFGTYVAVVEVFPETGQVDVKKIYLVYDVGKVVNPLLVEGQILGGSVQAIGQALYEEVVYSGDGALLTNSLTEYLIPSAVEVPEIVLERTETPAPNPLGTKGAGELATIGLTQAIVNAVEDALTPLNVRIEETPIKPSYIFELMRLKS
ncbi:MAG: xanthine dehydrogenase family protein molybdopterin-binding subunit [Nitrososphaerota archaeon]